MTRTALVVLLLPLALLRAADPPAKPLTAEEKAALRTELQTDREVSERLAAAGKTAEALLASDHALDIVRRLYPKADYPDGDPEVSSSVRVHATMLSNLGRKADAERMLKDVLAADRQRSKGPADAEVALDLRVLTGVLHDQGKWVEAEATAKEAAIAFRKIHDGKDDLAVVRAVHGHGVILSELGRHADAATEFKTALEMGRRIYGTKDDRGLLYMLSSSADTLRALGNTSEALERSGEAIAMAKRLNGGRDHSETAMCLDHYAALLQDAGRGREAEPVAREVVRMYRALDGAHDVEVGKALYNLSNILRDRGKVADAEQSLRESLVAFRRFFPNGDHPTVAVVMLNLSVNVQRRGDLTEAEALARDALAMQRRLFGDADNSAVPAGLSRVAQVLAAQGKHAAAIPPMREALAMNRRLHKGADNPAVAGNLRLLGNMLDWTGDSAEAEKVCREALEMDRRFFAGRDHERVADALSGLANAVSRRRPDEAAALYQEAIDLSRRLTEGRGDFGTAAYLYNLALLLQAEHRLDAAEKAMTEALELQRRTQPGHPFILRTLASLAFVLEAEGKSKEALPVLHDALATYRRLVADYSASRPEGDVLNLAAAHPIDLGNIFATARSLNLPPAEVYQEVWPAKAVLSQAFERRHLLARAAAVDPKAAGALKARTEARRRRADLLLAPAPRSADARKARDADLEELNDTIAKLDRELKTVLPGLGRAEELSKSAPAALQKALPADTAFVDFFRSRTQVWNADQKAWDASVRYHAFVVQSDRVRLVELGPAEELEAAVEPWRRAIATGKPVAPDEAAAVRQRVWEKVRAELSPAAKTVYLAPDAALARLPWAALPGDKAGTILLENFAVAVVPHGPFLLGQLGQREAAGSPAGAANGMLAVGGVAFDAAGAAPAGTRPPPAPLDKAALWPALPATEAEARGVQSLAAAAKVPGRALTREAATADAVLAELPKARYAHLATHGFFADPSFRKSLGVDPSLFLSRGPERVGAGSLSPLVTVGLALAGANRPDAPGRGLLTGEAIVDRDLSGLDLAVLSACETGIGEQASRGAETAFALQQAFHLAGARSVVASLWKVDDEATAALMAEFYRRLWDKDRPVPPVEALRQAQLTIYKNPGKVGELARTLRGAFETVPGTTSDVPVGPADTAHPRLWAAFVLSGRGQ
jgi:CHAT domain-containing protein/tetratricopeptide (TPR) repeat protein